MRILFGIFILLMLSSCSRFNLALRWADFFVAEYADLYFDLNSEQKKELKAVINEFIAEGRKLEFQTIANDLQELAKNIEEKSLSDEMMQAYNGKVRQHIKVFFSHLAPYIAAKSTSLSLEQWSHFEKKVEKEVGEQKSKVQDLERATKKRKETFEDSFEFWLDDLSKEQKERIHSFVDQTVFHWDLYFKNKTELAKKIADPSLATEKRKVLIEKIISDFEFARLPEYTVEQRKYQDKIFDLTKAILKTATTEQRKYMAERLRKLALAFAAASN